MAEQQQAVDSADAQIFAAKEAAADRRESSPPTSELSVVKMNPQVVTVEQEVSAGIVLAVSNLEILQKSWDE